MLVPFQSISPLRRALVLAGFWVSVLIAWTALHGSNPIIPTPAEVGRQWVELVKQGLFVRLVESYTLNLWGLLVSTALSLGLAYLSVVAVLQPGVALLSRLRFLGMTGITFAFGMYLSGRALQIGMLVFGIVVFYLTSMLSVVGAVPEAELDHARTLRMGPWQTVWEVVVRGTLDQALDVLRQNAAMGWMMLTMVEGLVRSEGGVGVMLIDQNRRLNLAGVFAIQASILAVGMLQDFLLHEVRGMVCPYTKER
jgi:NitT/TauT family transport system permease protein